MTHDDLWHQISPTMRPLSAEHCDEQRKIFTVDRIRSTPTAVVA